MSIKDFEFNHGAVLAKILRKDIPTSLKLVETNVQESWSAYRINDSVILYVKYSSPKKTQKHIRWTFQFNKKHLEDLKKYQDSDLRFALVCLGKVELKCKPEVCLLYKNQIEKLINIDSQTEQRINVYAEKNCELRVDGTISIESKFMNIKRTEIETMQIPG